MKIKKKFIVIFLLTFIIGFVSVLPTQKVSPNIVTVTALPEKSPMPPLEPTSKLETLEEVEHAMDEQKSPYKIKLLETGEGFHGDEIEAKSGEVWLGLFKERESYSLRSTKIKIRRVHDDIVDDEDETKKTGKSVEIEGKLKPIFLLKNANKLREASITTLFQRLTIDEISEANESEIVSNEKLTTLKKDFIQKYKIGRKEYGLKVIDAKNKNNEKILALILESNGIRQVLHTINAEYADSLGTVYWVGDLDRDEKPDFYFDLFEHENVENRVLFLSSVTEKGKLVKMVAQFWTTGC
jgi:hypothetical protein